MKLRISNANKPIHFLFSPLGTRLQYPKKMMTENRKFQKRYKQCHILKTLILCVGVDGRKGSYSKTRMPHYLWQSTLRMQYYKLTIDGRQVLHIVVLILRLTSNRQHNINPQQRKSKTPPLQH